MKKLIEYAKMVRDVVYYAYGGVGIVLIAVLAAMIGNSWSVSASQIGSTTPAPVEVFVAGALISTIVMFLSILFSQYHMKNMMLKAVFGIAQMVSFAMVAVVSIVYIESIIPTTYVILPMYMSTLETTASYLGLCVNGIMVLVLGDYAIYIIELFEKRKNNERQA
ncbi:MAG: hypothetical protein KAJ03_05115 [Gammaproteobacteria bacterium]|nr:hypothetical protein [Gammaproteobacteria bacterium]